MARRRSSLIAAATGLVLATTCHGAEGATGGTVVAVLSTQAVGNTAFAWTTAEAASPDGLGLGKNVPTRRLPGCGLWSTWTLIRVNPVSESRRYGEIIYDGCDGDAQKFPTPVDPTQGSCTNSDATRRSILYSLCPTLPKGTVPAGHLDSCLALAEASVALHATVTPSTYESSIRADLTAVTSFDSDFTQRLSDAICSDVLDWSVTSWEFTWPDGSTDALPGTGTAGATDSHSIDAISGGAAQTSSVVARAHIHITAQAVDFDDSAGPIVVRLTRDVVISNDAAANGIASQAAVLPAYTPPQLIAGSIAALQSSDGTLAQPDGARPAAVHADTLRGRLLELLPRAIVVRPGTESLAGVVIGDGSTSTVGWSYAGPATDAPPRMATRPGDSGSAATPVDVQWNHAERLDAAGRPLDELVPLTITVRTTYPDGHTALSSVTGSIAVSIFYVGLAGGNS